MVLKRSFSGKPQNDQSGEMKWFHSMYIYRERKSSLKSTLIHIYCKFLWTTIKRVLTVVVFLPKTLGIIPSFTYRGINTSPRGITTIGISGTIRKRSARVLVNWNNQDDNMKSLIKNAKWFLGTCIVKNRVDIIGHLYAQN